MESLLDIVFKIIQYEEDTDSDVISQLVNMLVNNHYCKNRILKIGINTVRIIQEESVLRKILEVLTLERILQHDEDENYISQFIELANMCYEKEDWNSRQVGVFLSCRLIEELGFNPRLFSLYSQIFPLLKPALDSGNDQIIHILVETHMRIGESADYLFLINMIDFSKATSTLVNSEYFHHPDVFYMALSVLRVIISNPKKFQNNRKYLTTISHNLFNKCAMISSELKISQISLDNIVIDELSTHLPAITSVERLSTVLNENTLYYDIMIGIVVENLQSDMWQKRFGAAKVLAVSAFGFKDLLKDRINELISLLCVDKGIDDRILYLNMITLEHLADTIPLDEYICKDIFNFCAHNFDNPNIEIMYKAHSIAVSISFHLSTNLRVSILELGFEKFRCNSQRLFTSSLPLLSSFLDLLTGKTAEILTVEQEFLRSIYVTIITDHGHRTEPEISSLILHHFILLCHITNTLDENFELIMKKLKDIKNIKYYTSILIFLKKMKSKQSDHYFLCLDYFMDYFLSNMPQNTEKMSQIIIGITTLGTDMYPYIGNILNILKQSMIPDREERMKHLYDTCVALLKCVKEQSLDDGLISGLFFEIVNIVLPFFFTQTDVSLLGECVNCIQKCTELVMTTVFSQSQVSDILLRELDLLSFEQEDSVDFTLELSSLNETLFKYHSEIMIDIISVNNFSFVEQLYTLMTMQNESLVLYSICTILDIIKYYNEEVFVKRISTAIINMDLTDFSVDALQVQFIAFSTLAQFGGNYIREDVPTMVEELLNYLDSPVSKSSEYSYCTGSAYFALGKISYYQHSNLSNQESLQRIWIAGISSIEDTEEREAIITIFIDYLRSDHLIPDNLFIMPIIEQLLSREKYPLSPQSKQALQQILHSSKN